MFQDMESSDVLSDILCRLHEQLSGTYEIYKRNSNNTVNQSKYRDAFEAINVGYYSRVPLMRKRIFRKFLEDRFSTSEGERKRYFDDLSSLLCNGERFSDGPLKDVVEPANLGDGTWPCDEIDLSLSAFHSIDECDMSHLSTAFWVGKLHQNRPFLVRQMCRTWKGVDLWGIPCYWKSGFPCGYVPAEIGGYRSPDFDVVIISLKDYAEYLTSPLKDRHIYLAQFDIFRHFPFLEEDVLPLPDFFYMAGEEITRFFFMGPAGSFTPLHRDPKPNFLAQVVGEKYIRLHPPDVGPSVYQSGSGNVSHITLDVTFPCNQMLDDFPHYSDCPRFDCILTPGDVLYIPPGWWHFVKNKKVSISVSHFMS